MKYQTLINAMNDVNGASFVGLDTLTVASLTGGKKNPHQGRVTKQMLGAQVMVFQNKNVNGYEEMIQRRLMKEGKDPWDFVLGERAWGTRVPNLPIIEHFKNDITQYYLEVIFLKPGKVQYFLDGVPIDVADIIGMPEDKDDGGQGGLSTANKVIIRSFKADSITEIRVNGKSFV